MQEHMHFIPVTPKCTQLQFGAIILLTSYRGLIPGDSPSSGVKNLLTCKRTLFADTKYGVEKPEQ
jgi:hypothetical protein